MNGFVKILFYSTWVFLFFLVVYAPNRGRNIITPPVPDYVSLPGVDSVEKSNTLGRDLFRANCTSCHAIGQNLIGPDLTRVRERRDKKWLYDFVRDGAKMVREGDTLAVRLTNEYDGMMHIPQALTNEEIHAILEYADGMAFVYGR